MNVTLPWPPSALRPNASSPGAWRRKQAAAKAYRAQCLPLCRTALHRPDYSTVHVHMDFAPPDRRRRDLDNMLASFKHGLDAVSEAIGIDDSDFSLSLRKVEPVKHGAVHVEVTAQ